MSRLFRAKILWLAIDNRYVAGIVMTDNIPTVVDGVGGIGQWLASELERHLPVQALRRPKIGTSRCNRWTLIGPYMEETSANVNVTPAHMITGYSYITEFVDVSSAIDPKSMWPINSQYSVHMHISFPNRMFGRPTKLFRNLYPRTAIEQMLDQMEDQLCKTGFKITRSSEPLDDRFFYRLDAEKYISDELAFAMEI